MPPTLPRRVVQQKVSFGALPAGGWSPSIMPELQARLSLSIA
jgi:hypothetical protein